MKLTEWFPANVKPVHNGVYKVKEAGSNKNWFSNWNGKNWSGLWFTAERAEMYKHLKESRKYSWRGIAK